MSDVIPPSKNIYVKKSHVRGAGRGVFARNDISEGDIIETCPVIEISVHDMANINESILLTYFFFYGKENNQALLTLGFGSLYNHSYTPNAKYVIHKAKKLIVFIAVHDIARDTEITFNYKSGTIKNSAPLWFEGEW